MERERKALEDELKRQTRLAKEREVEQRRKKEEEKELAWLEMKEATRKRKEEAAKQIKLLETEVRQQASKVLICQVLSTSGSPLFLLLTSKPDRSGSKPRVPAINL